MRAKSDYKYFVCQINYCDMLQRVRIFLKTLSHITLHILAVTKTTNTHTTV